MEPSSQSSLVDLRRAKDAERKRLARAKRTAAGDAAPKRKEARRAVDAKRKRPEQQFLEAFRSLDVGATPSGDHLAGCDCVMCESIRVSIGAFADAINTGYYVNSYTTKQCPTMEGVLDHLRIGVSRLEEQKKREEDDLKAKRLEAERGLGRSLTNRHHVGSGRPCTYSRKTTLLRT